MFKAFVLAAGLEVVPCLLALMLVRYQGVVSLFHVAVALATNFFFFHASAAALYGLIPHGWAYLLLATAMATIMTAAAMLSSVRWRTPTEPAKTLQAPLIAAAILTFAAISTDAWIFSLQGFSFEDRTSRFAAPFAGDHWRHVSIIAGLLRHDQSIFLPNSELVYQILWHHGAAAVIGALPSAPTLFKYELGVALATGLVFYLVLFLLVFELRPQLVRLRWPLLLVAVLLGTDADLFNASLSWLTSRELAIAADSSTRIPSVFRYFSAKLISMTAPQHAAFFICASVSIVALPRGVQLSIGNSSGWRPQVALAAVFVIPAVLFSPVLSLLIFPLLYGAAAISLLERRQAMLSLIGSAAVAVVLALLAHWLILRFPLWDPFLRANLTGGGSGQYGLRLLPWIHDFANWARQLTSGLIAMAGVTGLVLTVAVIWAAIWNRDVLRDPLVMAVLGGAVLWNFVVVDTEIQRHFSMIVAVIGVIAIVVHLPLLTDSRRRKRIGVTAIALCAALCVGLNSVLVRAYTRNASFVPLTVAWPDYFCANDIIAKKYPGLSVVVRTPVNFELPISSEATTSLVWSQIAAVHQRAPAETVRILEDINPRDWRTFRNRGEADGTLLLSTLRRLGYDGAIWGPLEDREYGATLRELFARPENFLDGCGTVGLYTLGGRYRASTDAATRHQRFLRDSAAPFDALFSRVPGLDARLAKVHLPSGVPGQNLARGARAVQSSTRFSSVAAYAIDGNSALAGVPMAFTDNQFSPWWEVDLGAVRNIDSLRVSTLENTPYPQFELKAFYVLVSETPFQRGTLFEAGIESGVTSYFVPGRIAGTGTIDIGRRGRYIRLQGTTLGHLVLSEVEVLGSSMDTPGRER